MGAPLFSFVKRNRKDAADENAALSPNNSVRLKKRIEADGIDPVAGE